MSDAELQQTSREVDLTRDDASPIEYQEEAAVEGIPEDIGTDKTNGEVKLPSTPIKNKEKPLPKEPAMTPRIKKKIPWKGKNIMVLVPRDDQRGCAGGAPMPLRPEDVDKMFSSWKELGYSVEGFDLLVEGYQPPGTDDSQSREDWPTDADMVCERSERSFKVLLPDLNAWKNYVDELQEAKLRALGVSYAEEEPPEPSISPPTTNPSRQPSVQYPSLPFSPPIPTSSASSNHGLPSYPFPAQFFPASASPGLPAGSSPVPFAPGKFNPRQSISLPTGNSPFQLAQSQGWSNPAGILQGLSRTDSPLANLNGILSPQSPYGLDGLQQTASPGFNPHQRHQSLQYFPQQMASIASPRLQDVREDDEENLSKSPSKTPEPTMHNGDNLQAEIEDAEYHLEEQLRNQLEHEDYNPQSAETKPFAPIHNRDASSQGLTIAERFANEPGKPMELHHPRPHSRGHSLTQTFYQEQVDERGLGQLGSLKELPETQRDENEAEEIETNPSNLGTPVQNFDFAAAFGQHQKSLSTVSNPWHEQESVASSTRRSSHGSKPSMSKLNVQAPEFKFNPTSSFTPGGMYNFSAGGFQPAVFQAGIGSDSTQPLETMNPVPQFGASKMHASAPSFSPGQGVFSFSSSGPKFRPDAPSFTPFQSLGGSSGLGRGHTARQDSIFGNISIPTQDIVRPAKKSKAIPIIRPSSRSSAQSPHSEEEDGPQDGPDGRFADEFRVKRAKSAVPDGDSMPTFAARPDEDEDSKPDESNGVKDDIHSAAEDGSVDGDQTQPGDTSLSSIITSDQIDTKATTAAPSETSPAEQTARNFSHFEFDPTVASQEFPSTGIFGNKGKGSEERKSLSATAMPFIPGGASPAAQLPSSSTGSDKERDSAQESPAQEAVSEEPTPQAQAPRVKLTPKPRGLAASRFAKPQSPAPVQEPEIVQSIENEPNPVSMPAADTVPAASQDQPLVDVGDDREMTFEEIDAVMQQMETDPSMGVNKTLENSNWQSQLADGLKFPPVEVLQSPAQQFSGDGTSPTPRQFNAIPASTPMLSTELEDPFVDPPISPRSPEPANEFDDPEIASEQASDWEGAFTEDEHDKLENRAHFFDGRVNEVVGTLLASRLEPLERTLAAIQDSISAKNRRNPSTRREVRSVSGDMQESDADDEDEEPAPQRSMSPRRDRRMEHIRLAVTEAFAAQQRNQPVAPVVEKELTVNDHSAVMQALEEMKEHLTASLKASMSSEDKESEARDRELLTPGPDEHAQHKINELQSMMMDLAERLSNEQKKTEKEISERRAAEDAGAELNRKLQAAETRVEVEIINRSVFDQRVADLEERLRLQEDKNEEEVKNRRAAEDRLSEVQRLLRISSEEESRLRDVVDEKDTRVKALEQSGGKNAMRMTLLEAAQTNSTKTQAEMTNKFNVLDADLKAVRQDNNHWRAEAERADETARRNAGELAHTLNENKHLQKSLNTLTAQLEENERLRESWRSKFLSLQEDMGKAAREVAEENARHIKKDQAMLARQEVLEARLQAEAKTRERLEVEMERLQENERSGMRAVNECKRLESLLGELRTENHQLQQSASRYQREFEEARESGASEVKRTRMSLQTEIDAANNQVNVIREELEEQNSKLRTELDHVKLEADTAKAQNEMLLEDAQATKGAELEAAERKHQNEIEDLQARYERRVNNANEDASRTEQQLLERLSLSSSKIEHLQDRIMHLEDKLEIAKEAAAAAAAAAKSAGIEPAAAAIVSQPRQVSKSLEPPEKISPQALRESIMVLQEQLQAREQRIEELEQTLSKSDPDASAKISKRDDEISWLRELLAVRHGDLQDIITALSGDHYDRDTIKDAAIRLKANLQMEEQERERAMNGGSAISLPNIAQSIQAATPRVAQTIGPIAAAWGNWRKSSQPSFRTISGVLSSPAGGSNATPSKSRSGPSSQNSLLSGLLTPPASGLRQTPTSDNRPQPTAFSSTGRRYTAQGSSSLDRDRRESNSSRRSEKMPAGPNTPPRHQERTEQPRTPPMMRQSGYDSDAQPGDFDDHDFFEED